MKRQKICCVYQIENIKSGLKYVGSTTDFFRRKRQHLHELKRGTHPSKNLQADFIVSGKLYFSFSVIEEISEERLESREQYWIDELHPRYNTSRFARKPDELIVFSEKAKKNRSETVKKLWQDPEYRKRCSAPRNWKNGVPNRKGAKLSEETKEKLRQINLGEKNPNWGLHRSAETKAKTSKANAHTYKGAISPDGVVYSPIVNMSKFCEAHGLNISSMVSLMHHRRKQHKGWTALE